MEPEDSVPEPDEASPHLPTVIPYDPFFSESAL